MNENHLFIAVIGGYPCSNTERELAKQTGRELARRGVFLICGGEGGVMEAACEGAHSEGGITIGILPGNNRTDANQFISIPVVTGLGSARNVIVVKSAQAVIAIGGGYGTLSEIGFALKFGIPVIGLNTWELSRNGKGEQGIIRSQDPAAAVETAIRLAAATGLTNREDLK